MSNTSRVVLLLVGALLVLWGAFFVFSPRAIEEHKTEATLPSEEPITETEIPDFSGIYVSDLMPSASSPGRIYTLTLSKNNSAELLADYQNGKTPIAQSGTWQGTEDEKAIITLEMQNGTPLSDSQEMIFVISETALTLTDYSFDEWGASGLVLRKQTSLAQTSWEWIRTTLSDDTVTAPNKSGDFILTFTNEKSFAVKTDCNRLRGTYSIRGNTITFSQILSTKMACLPDSKENTFSKYLPEATSFLVQDSRLILDLKMDSGNMEFSSVEQE